MLDARDLPDGQLLSADVCIVGAGAAGISMALEFAGSGLEVLLLESGGAGHEKPTQALYEGGVADERQHSPLHRYRERRLGGSTTIWGGRCVPFDDIDFQARTWMPHSGWPFGRGELLPYYVRANQLCEAGTFAYGAAESLGSGARPMIGGFQSTLFSADGIERFSCPTDFGRRYADQLRAARNICVLLHANVTALRLDPAGTRVDGATVRTLTGKSLGVRAGHFVLATGGLETVRLLLASRDVHRNGIGNQYDVVGRYYMCHMAGTIGTLTFARPETVWHGYDVSVEGIYCRRRLALTAAAQQQLQAGNFIARLHHPRITDPGHRTGLLSLLYLAKAFIPYEYAKRLHDGQGGGLLQVLAHVGNVLRDPFGTAAFLLHWLRYRTLPRRKFPSIIIKSRADRYSLDFHAEQWPNPASRVTLGSGHDALGMPKLHVDWRYTAGDVVTVQRAVAALAAELRRCGVGQLDYDPATVESEMTRYGAYGGHHIGTTRMGGDPRSSVVDSDCRVHGVDNLFIASSSVFPTSSQANPTLTIIALALRLAAHLKKLDARERSAQFVAPPPTQARERVVRTRDLVHS
ncbi:MAG: GMC family oxidoreductase [Nevskia sp.]|nr:GMC family oxidoreductase [Nevskia sp.]